MPPPPKQLGFSLELKKDYKKTPKEISRYEKLKKENPLAVDLAEDTAKDAAMARSPQATFKVISAFEKLRRLAQKGTVPGAEKALALARATAPVGSKLLGKIASPPVGAAIEIGRGVNIAMTPPTEGSFDAKADAGDKLRTQPTWYQVGNSLVNTAEAFSQYGASAERSSKKPFEKKYDINRILAEKQAQMEEVNQAIAEMKRRRKKVTPLMETASSNNEVRRYKSTK